MREAIAATTHATAILVTTSVPDLRSTVPVALNFIDAPCKKPHRQNGHRTGNHPVGE